MEPRMPRPSLYQKKGTNTALIAVMWTLVAVKIVGLGFMGFSTLASGPFTIGYTVLGIVLARSSNQVNRINGWIVVSYTLFEFLIGVGRGLSRHI